MAKKQTQFWAYRMPGPLNRYTPIYKATCPLSSAQEWYTVARIPNPSTMEEANGERVMSPHLPVRSTQEQAQADLDAWIVKRRLVRCCAVCGCTDEDCSQCVAKLGHPCSWAMPGLCSACDQDISLIGEWAR